MDSSLPVVKAVFLTLLSCAETVKPAIIAANKNKMMVFTRCFVTVD
jgi:hypothetical protein